MTNVVVEEDMLRTVEEEITVCDECGREADDPYTVETVISGLGRRDDSSEKAIQHLCDDCLDSALTRSAGDRLSEINIDALAESPNRSGIYFNEEYRDLIDTVRKEMYVIVSLLVHTALWVIAALYTQFPTVVCLAVIGGGLVVAGYQCYRIFDRIAGFRSHMR